MEPKACENANTTLSKDGQGERPASSTQTPPAKPASFAAVLKQSLDGAKAPSPAEANAPAKPDGANAPSPAEAKAPAKPEEPKGSSPAPAAKAAEAPKEAPKGVSKPPATGTRPKQANSPPPSEKKEAKKPKPPAKAPQPSKPAAPRQPQQAPKPAPTPLMSIEFTRTPSASPEAGGNAGLNPEAASWPPAQGLGRVPPAICPGPKEEVATNYLDPQVDHELLYGIAWSETLPDWPELDYPFSALEQWNPYSRRPTPVWWKEESRKELDLLPTYKEKCNFIRTVFRKEYPFYKSSSPFSHREPEEPPRPSTPVFGATPSAPPPPPFRPIPTIIIEDEDDGWATPDDEEVDREVGTKPTSDDIFTKGEAPQSDDPEVKVRAFCVTHQDKPTPLLEGLVLAITPRNKVILKECLTGTQEQSEKAYEWAIRHGIATGKFPRSFGKLIAMTELHSYFHDVITEYIDNVHQTRLTDPTTPAEKAVLGVLLTQLPNTPGKASYSKITLAVSCLNPHASPDEPVTTDGTITSFLESLRNNISGLDLGIGATTIASSIISIGCQCYTAAMIDWAQTPTSVKASIIAGIVTSVTAAAGNIYQVYRVTSNLDLIAAGVRALIAKERLEASGTLITKGILKLVFAGIVASGCRAVGKNVSDIGHAMRGADSIISELDNTLSAIARWANSEDDVLLTQCKAAFDENARLIAQPIGAFVRLEHVNEVDKRIDANTRLAATLNTMIRAGSPDEAGAAKALLANLTLLSNNLMQRKTDAATVGAINGAIRPEPVCINFYGPGGHGKTHWLLNEFIPAITKAFNLNGKVVNASTTHGEYFPPISDEDILIIDEFMGHGVNEPFLKIWNGLFSQSPINIDSAFVKNQNPYFRFVITMGNPDPSKISIVGPKYTEKYQKSFRQRLLPIHAYNTMQDPLKDRNEQEHHVLKFTHKGQEVDMDWMVKKCGFLYEKFDQVYRNALTKAADRFQALNEDPITISINGPPGAGKTTMAKELANTYSRLLRRPVISNKMVKSDRPSIYVLDDSVVGNETEFGHFYDLLTAQDMIISTNNISFDEVRPWKLTRLYNSLAHDVYYTSPQLERIGTYRRIGFNKPVWCKNEYVQYPGQGICLRMENHMILHNGKAISAESLFRMVGKRIAEARVDVAPKYVSELPEIVQPNIQVKLAQLDKNSVLGAYTMPSDEQYIRLNGVSVAELQQAFESLAGAEPNEDAVIRGCAYLASHFPNYTAYIEISGLRVAISSGVYVRSKDPHRLAECASFEDTVDSCTVIYGGRRTCFNVEELVKINSGSGTQVPRFWGLPSQAKVAIADHVSKNWANKRPFLDAQSGYAYMTAKEKFLFRSVNFAKDLFNWFKEHKVIALIAGFGVLLTTIGLTALAMRSREKEDPPIGTVTRKSQRVLRVQVPGMLDICIGQCPDCWSWYCDNPWCKGSSFLPGDTEWQAGAGLQVWPTQEFESGNALIKRVVEKLQSDTDDEDVPEPRLEQQRQVVRPKKRAQRQKYAEPEDDGRMPTSALSLALNNPTKYRYTGTIPDDSEFQAVSTLQISRKAVDKEGELVVERLREATCFVKSSRSGLISRGLFVGGNKVLCNTHLFPADDDEGGLVFDDEHPEGMPCQVFSCLKDRDLLIVEITDKKFPPKKTITQYFVKDADLRAVRDIRLVIFNQTTANITTGKSVLVPTILNSSVASAIHWDNPRTAGKKLRAPAIAVYWAGISGIPTENGTCGSAYIAANTALGARRIVAIHSVGAPSALTTKGAVCSQEDLCALLTGPAFEDEQFQSKQTAVESIPHPFSDVPVVAAEPELTLIRQSEPIRLFDIAETDRFHQIGFCRSAFRPPFNKSDHIRSTFHQWTSLPDTCCPAPTDTRHMTPEALSKLATKEGRPDLLAQQLSHVSFMNFPIDEDVLASVEDFIFSEYADIYADWRPLNDHEIKNGVSNVNSPLYGFINALDGDKSSGFWGAWKKAGKKADFFENTAPKGERPCYRWAATERSVDLRVRYESMYKLAEQGIALADTIESRAKSELLPAEKVAEGKVRLFENVGFATVLFHKKYVGAFTALAQKHRLAPDNSFTVGLNPYTETAALYQALRQISDVGEDGDFSRYDKRMHPKVQDTSGRLKARWAKAAQPGLSPTVLDNVFKVITHQNKCELHVCAGNPYWTNGSYNSGGFETNWEDGLDNIIIRWYCVAQAARSAGDTRPVEVILNTTKKLHRFFVNGDDIFSAIQREITTWLNFHTLQKEYAKIGMMYDLTTKDGGEGVPFKPIEELGFSSRQFRFINKSVVVGALKKSSIERAFHWTTNNTATQLSHNMSVALLEAFFWGREYYDFIVAEVLQMRRRYLNQFGERLDINIRSYNKMLQLYLESPTLEWLEPNDPSEHYESSNTNVIQYHRSNMNFNDARKCPICTVLCTNQRSYSRHVIHSHPKEEVFVPCPGPFCNAIGTPTEMRDHRCKTSGDFKCLCCSSVFRTYEAAANHHLSVHNRNATTLASYFAEVHADLDGSVPAAFQSGHAADWESKVDPALATIGRLVIKNHVEFAEKVAIAAGQSVYIEAKEPGLWNRDAMIDGRWRVKVGPAGFYLFGSASIPPGLNLWHEQRIPVLEDNLGWRVQSFKPVVFYDALEPVVPADLVPAKTNKQVLLEGLTGLKLSAIEHHQSAEASSAGNPLAGFAPQGGPSVGMAEGPSAADNLTPRVEELSTAPVSPPMTLDMTPPSSGGVTTGPPTELIAMSGPRLILEDVVRGISQIVADGSIPLSAEAGTVFAELVYGTNLPNEAFNYIKSHEIFSGSFDFSFDFFSNAALNGAIIIGWQPFKRASYSLNQLRQYPHRIINLQGTCVETETLHDRRQNGFWRNTSEINTPGDDRPRLVCAVWSQLSSFINEQGPSIRYKILQKLNPNFCVNNFIEWFGGNSNQGQDAVDPSLFFQGIPAIVTDGAHQPEYLRSETGPYFNAIASTFSEKTGLNFPTGVGTDFVVPDGVSDAILASPASLWRVFMSGTLPANEHWPSASAPTLQDFYRSTEPVSVSTSIDNWVPSESMWTVDTAVPIQGGTNSPGVCTVWRHTNEFGQMGTLIIVKCTDPAQPFSSVRAQLGSFDSVITSYIGTTIPPPNPNYHCVVFSTRPEVEPDFPMPRDPVMPRTTEHKSLVKALVQMAESRGIKNKNFTVSVYQNGTNIGSLLVVNVGYSHTVPYLYANTGLSYAFYTAEGIELRDPLIYQQGSVISPLQQAGWTPKSQTQREQFASLLERVAQLELALGEQYQGAAASMVGAGALQGIGSGLGQWQQNQNSLHQMGVHYGYESNMNNQDWANRTGYNAGDWRFKAGYQAQGAALQAYHDSNVRRSHMASALQKYGDRGNAAAQRGITHHTEPVPANKNIAIPRPAPEPGTSATAQVQRPKATHNKGPAPKPPTKVASGGQNLAGVTTLASPA